MLTEAEARKYAYEDRLKAMHDRQTWLKAADYARAEGLAEGEAKGLARGDLRGRIELAQRILRREPTPRALLDAMPLDALAALADELERELLP